MRDASKTLKNRFISVLSVYFIAYLLYIYDINLYICTGIITTNV